MQTEAIIVPMTHLRNDTRDLVFIVGTLQDDFDRISHGVEVAWNTSGALHRLDIETAKRDAPRISEQQRDRLIKGLVLAHGPIVDLFHTSTERFLATRGVDAAAGLIITWAESSEQRAARHPHVRIDLQASARWLRNACHNLCLLGEIEDRARQRRHAEIVAEIVRRACA